MPQSLTLAIKTRTPLWTGGLNGTCDRLHISGLMGSLRYWYEAIVRGAGGYACDPSEGNGCLYDKVQGIASICAACYLFGTTGWARLFRLTAMLDSAPDEIGAAEPVHFRTLNDMNARWLKTVFEGTDNNRPEITLQRTIFLQNAGSFRFVWRGIDAQYAQGQLLMLFWLLENHAGLGAKQQFGFGQIHIESPHLTSAHWDEGLLAYINRKGDWLAQGNKEHPLPQSQAVFGKVMVPPPSLAHFFTIACVVQGQTVGRKIKVGQTPASMANLSNTESPAYLSSAFDLRYKGDGGSIVGLRRLLDVKNPNGWGWSHAAVNAFLGASHQKGEAEMKDDERNASRVFFSMPYLISNPEQFMLRVYGFALPELAVPGGQLTVEKAIKLCSTYLTQIKSTHITSTAGPALLTGVQS